MNNPNDIINFYGRKVSQAQLEPLVKFYNVDRELTTEDRQTMVSDLEKVRNTSLVWGVLDGSLAFFVPTMYRRYVSSKGAKPAEALSKTPVRRFIHRPLLSVAIGSLAYFTSILYNVDKQIKKQVEGLSASVSAAESEAESASLKRMLGVWKNMFPSQITFYYMYYWKTSRDPSFILKDPVQLTQNPHEVHFIPPAQQKRTFGGFVSEPEQQKNSPHWDQIRKENGFAEEKAGPLPEAEIENVSELPSDSEQAAEKPTSAWERLRKGN